MTVVPPGVVPPAVVPAGIVTFLFTDVEGSTRLWAADPTATGRSLQIHDVIIKDAIQDRGGYVFGWAGDHFRGAFEDPRSAVGAAIAAQAALARADWQGGPALKVRMGLHRGRATERDGDYFGPVPNTASRVEALAAGGQILMTDAVHNVVDIEDMFLGEHRLRDVPEPVGIHQVGIETFRALQSTDPALSSLPLLGAPIVGRRDEIREVRELLESSAMVTLTGIGGCGKTRLAVEVGHQELPGRHDGCYFADLSSVSEGEELPAAIARAVRLELGGPVDAMDQIVAHLASRDALLILDNCEHIVDECAEFAEALLRVSSSTALLATTRQRLGIAGENVVAVPSLDHDGPETPAVELFIERAKVANPAFTPVGEDRYTIGEICGRLDGMPLAIELAAARVAVLTPDEILDRMADRFRLLSGGRGRHRRRTLQATLDWSYDLLDIDEQRFFARLGLFVGSFDLPAAVAVSGMDDYDAMDVLQSLVAKNLVVVETHPDQEATRYRLLETVRIYAGDQLARSEEATQAQRLYVNHYTRLAHVDSFAAAASLDRALAMRWQWPNIAATLEHLTTVGEWEAAADIAFGVSGLWDTQFPAVEARRWAEPILDSLDELEVRGSLEDPLVRDRLRYAFANVLMQLDDWTGVHDNLETLVADSAPEPRAHAAGLLAFLCCREHAYRTPELAELGRRLVAEHDLARESQVASEWALGCLALYRGDYEDARDAFEVTHDLVEGQARETNEYVMSGLSLATAEVMTGNPDGAIDVLDSYDWSRSVWDASPIIRAVALIELGRINEAADLTVTFGYNALRGRLPRQSNDALVGLAALAINRGADEHAWKLLQESASPRHPFTIVLGEWLAEKIGYGTELRHMHRGRVVPLADLDATPALRAELERIRTER